jgi:hypothetical protein
MATETGDGSTGESEDGTGEPVEPDSQTGTTSTDEAPLTGNPASETGTDDELADEEAFDQFTRSVLVTTIATMFGLVAGIVSMLGATSQVGSVPQTDELLGVAILVAAVFVQFPIYSVLGLNPEDFETKTQIYVFVMTFFMWFITWTVLLTTRAFL